MAHHGVCCKVFTTFLLLSHSLWNCLLNLIPKVGASPDASTSASYNWYHTTVGVRLRRILSSKCGITTCGVESILAALVASLKDTCALDQLAMLMKDRIDHASG